MNQARALPERREERRAERAGTCSGLISSQAGDVVGAIVLLGIGRRYQVRFETRGLGAFFEFIGELP